MNQGKVNILALEDNDFDFDLISRQLKTLGFPYLLERATGESEFKSLVQEFSPHLVLSDFSLPSYNGLEALRFLKETSPHTPFIFVSGTIGEELAVESLKEGAVDYVLKQKLVKLGPAVKRALQERKEQEKREQAEEKLKVKVDELKTLVYRISHDFKAPICTIKGATNLYWTLKKEAPKEVDTSISIIEKVTGKMDNILLNLSSFQHLFKDDISINQINFHDLWERSRNLLLQDESFNKANVKVKIQEDVEFTSEKNFLFFILHNLIHNSVTFSDHSKPEVNVNCEVKSSKSGIELSVEDNGIGIPEGIKDKVFNMFFRGNSASKGAGLGLYIIKNGLDQLSGAIKIESNEGKGTKVTVQIPNSQS